jgi:hypothetical protein
MSSRLVGEFEISPENLARVQREGVVDFGDGHISYVITREMPEAPKRVPDETDFIFKPEDPRRAREIQMLMLRVLYRGGRKAKRALLRLRAIPNNILAFGPHDPFWPGSRKRSRKR